MLGPFFLPGGQRPVGPEKLAWIAGEPFMRTTVRSVYVNYPTAAAANNERDGNGP
ncbi:hypothetical protein ACVIWU_006785 [Bradyrhizobium sp. USDA 4509]